MAVRLVGSFGTWELPPGKTLVGRSRDCAICLLDGRLSRQHACFHVKGSALSVEDLGSTNGILHNGHRITGTVGLDQDDEVIIGPCVLRVTIDDSTPSANQGERIAITGLQHVDALTETEEIPHPRGLGRRIDAAIHEEITTFGMIETEAHEQAPTHPEEPASDLLPAVADHPPSTKFLRPSAFWQRQTIGEPTAGIRALAGVLDTFQTSLVSALVALPCLALAFGLALQAAGAGLDQDDLPHLAYGEASSTGVMGIAYSLLRPGGVIRAWELTGELQQQADPWPATLLFLGTLVAVLAFLLTHLVMTVYATVIAGAPFWHRRFGMVIIDTARGRTPGWSRALLRWMILLVVWPVAWIWVLARQPGLHDRWSGCEVRQLG